MKKLWLRDYDLPKMQENIRNALAEGKDPDDCVVNIKEVERYVKSVFDDFDELRVIPRLGIVYKSYEKLKERHLSTFAKSDIIADKQNPQGKKKSPEYSNYAVTRCVD